MVVGKTDTISIAPLPDVVHSRTAFPKDIDDADFLFTFKSDGFKVIRAIQFVVDCLNRYANKGEYPIVDAIYLRFFKGTNGGLSTSSHDDDEFICAFDLVSVSSIPGYVDFKKEIVNFFMNELHARPHWGKTVPLSVDYAKLYGKRYQDYMRALTAWHETCYVSIENNPFFKSLFSYRITTTFYAKNCITRAASRSTDVDIRQTARRDISLFNTILMSCVAS